jgi:hypothetical protein
MPAMSGFTLRATITVVWLLIVAVISVGAAGLVAAMAHQPGTPARAELTLDGDAAVQPGLDAAQARLVDLAKDVDQLGELGRAALAAMVASDFTALDSVVADGQTLAHSIEVRSAQIRESIALLPGTGPSEELTWSPETRQRRDQARAAADATGGLEILWSRLASGSVTAARLTKLLVDHDTVAGQAAALGRKGRYADGLTQLTQADGIIADARTMRDGLANTVDVSTLTQWLDRNAEYDTALRKLFQALIDSKLKVTAAVKQAFADERKAHDLLPANTSGLVIILAEIGRGGLNQAVIGIEETRAGLQAAVDRLTTAPAGPDASPNASPGDATGSAAP